jgi:hypothetical protein
MATGDQNDFENRISKLLPKGWFGDDGSHPIVDALVAAGAAAWAWCYSLYAYAVLQTRILTSTGGWLDLAAYDFFGDNIQRSSGQSDESFLNTIKINMFRERGTRAGLISILEDLTGNTPIVIEPTRPQDCGAYGAPNIGYGVAGAYGSMLTPYQCFVTAFRPTGSGFPYIAGYGSTVSGYSVASQGEYVAAAEVTGSSSFVTDAQIYEAINSVKLEGTTIWVCLQ